MEIRTCELCAAMVADQAAHQRWHEELQAAVEQAARSATNPPHWPRRAS